MPIQCQRCGHAFRDNGTLQRHLARKRLCKENEINNEINNEENEENEENNPLPVAIPTCPECGKTYKFASSLSRHRKICLGLEGELNKMATRRKNKIPVIQAPDETDETDDKNHTNIDGENTSSNTIEVTETISPVIPRENAATSQPKNGKDEVKHEDTIAPIVTRPEHIRVFGEENRPKRITYKQIWDLLSEVIKVNNKPKLHGEQAERVILMIARLLYGNEDHPEDITCFLPSKNSNEVIIHQKHGWRSVAFEEICGTMVRKSLDVLYDRQPGFGGKDFNDMDFTERRWFQNDCADFLRYIIAEEESIVSNGVRKYLHSLLITSKALLEIKFGKAPKMGDK
jgi:uncharacterized C2H2 Zn-finger protein